MSFYFDIEIDGLFERILVKTPKRRIYNELNELLGMYDGKNKAITSELYKLTAEILTDNIYKINIDMETLKAGAGKTELMIIINKYLSFVSEIINGDTCKIPFCPQDSEEEPVKYECTTGAERIVFEHTGINFIEQQEIRIDEFYRYLRDAIIFNRSGSKEGREYLEDCWMLEQTEPDTEGLRAAFGKKEI